MKKITTHTNPDMDAVMCVLFTEPEFVDFVSADYKGPFKGQPYDLAAGGKGDFIDGQQHSAAAAMARQKGVEIAPRLLDEVEEQETTGKVVSPRFSIPELLNAVKGFLRSQGLRGEEFDRAVLDWARPMLLGIQQQWEARKKAQEEITTAKKVFLGCGVKGLMPQNSSPQLGIMANEMGYSFTIYESEGNLGISRFPGRETPDLRLLEAHLPGWFIHPAGFLAAWGSRKAPAKTPPPPGTPQNAEELAELMLRVFG